MSIKRAKKLLKSLVFVILILIRLSKRSKILSEDLMQEKTFEAGLEALEKIVKKLEEGNLTLEESYQYFEKGMKIVRFCEQKIKEIEKKVEILMQENEKLYLKDYKPESEDYYPKSEDDLPF